MLFRSVKSIHGESNINLKFLAGDDHPAFICDDEEVLLCVAILHLFQVKATAEGALLPLSLVLSAINVTVSLTGFPELSVKYN